MFRAHRLHTACTRRECHKLRTLFALFFVSGLIALTDVFLGSGPQRSLSVPDNSSDLHEVIQPDDYLQQVGAIQRDPEPFPFSIPRDSLANLTAQDGSWQSVNGTRDKFFVFSAYLDERGGSRRIRIIGATRTKSPEPVHCRLWRDQLGAAETVKATVRVIRENWNLKYSAVYVLCPLDGEVPGAVSVLAQPGHEPHNLLLVRDTRRGQDAGQGQDSLGVCVKPLHYTFNRALEMLEFLELYTLLGAQYFIFYNNTIGPQVSCILEDYSARGLVTVLPWRLDIQSQKEIRTEGQFAAFNDCLYRSMPRHTLLALVDVDEYLVPRQNYTLPEFVQWLGTRQNTQAAGAFSFQNAFFYRQWPDDQDQLELGSVESRLLTARKTIRRTKLNPHRERSKYICVPERVVEAGNHFIWEYMPGYRVINVDPSAAILHHYRVCEFGGDDCVKLPNTLDRTAHRYKGRLAARVSARWAALRDQCQLGDLMDATLQ